MDKAFGQFRAALGAMSLKKKISLLLVFGLLAAGFVYLINWSGRPDYQSLFVNLSAEDAGLIVDRLKGQKIPYRITADGSCIQIPEEKVHELRMTLASEGLPQGAGIGFEVFDNAKLGMTEFMQNVNYQRALQGELSRTINQIDEIESSRIHLVMPEQTLFVEEERPASASVVLKLKPGRRLNQNQIQGIVHLVSSSISGLETENVTVVDNRGKLLAGRDDPSSAGALSSDQFMYQRRMETTLENRVKTMLEEVLGPNKAIVRVSCDLDFMRHEQTEEMYLPQNQVVRSEQFFNETTSGEGSLPMGVPGVSANIEPGSIGTDVNRPAVGGNRGKAVFQKQDQTKNYEIGKVVSRKVMPYANLQRVSAAVIVDGSYAPVASKKRKKESAPWQYTARSAEEMQQFERIVKRAINFSAQRGDAVEIQNIPFETTKLDAETEVASPGGWATGLKRFKFIFDFLLIGLFIIMSFIFLVRPLIKWLTAENPLGGEIIRQLPKTVGELEREYQGAGGQISYMDQARQKIAAEGQNSIGVMKEWIKQ
ncbi:MAG: flagellar basal-body MS-ring/collar protein FliF [Desulfobacterales bacterium]|nr:flagellar basal-body MS-ring/collar protein FliF [Desulfobacterales bacterium]MDJ0988536.1 flagellar basal-body MS-ring/collar protein FliF [Desulfobacterales bacterium]